MPSLPYGGLGEGQTDNVLTFFVSEFQSRIPRPELGWDPGEKSLRVSQKGLVILMLPAECSLDSTLEMQHL